MADYDRGYRTSLRDYGSSDRKLEIVSGKVFSADQTLNAAPRLPPPETRSPDPPRRISATAVRPPSSSSSGAWSFSDPEMKRQRRVVSYKAYTVESKVKSSLRKGFRWIKGKCSELVHGR